MTTTSERRVTTQGPTWTTELLTPILWNRMNELGIASYRELAKRAQLSPTIICNSFQTRTASDRTIAKLATALHMPPNAVYQWKQTW